MRTNRTFGNMLRMASMILAFTAISQGAALAADKTAKTEADVRNVSPTLQLAGLIDKYENGPRLSPEIQERLKMAELHWRKAKAEGRAVWGRDRAHYRKLSTEKLAEQCLTGETVFWSAISMYDEPAFGLQRLSIMHDGFAELFERKDMWKGVLYAYDRLADDLNLDADLKAIVLASGNLESMRYLYGYPPLREQVRGREALFLSANLRVLKKYRWYLDRFDSEKLGTEGTPGFFCEPCLVAQVALMLAKQVAPKQYDRIAPKLTSVRWTSRQDLDDLRDFLDAVIAETEPVLASPKETDR